MGGARHAHPAAAGVSFPPRDHSTDLDPTESCVKITKIESLTFDDLPRLMFVRVHTDSGIVGLGETYDKVSGSQGALHGTLAPILLGNDPREIDRLWQWL